MPRKTKRGSGRAVGRSRRAAVRGKHNPRSMKAAGACNPLDRHMASLLDYNVRLAAVKLDSPPTLEWVRGVASEISTKRVPSKAQLESALRSAIYAYEWAVGKHNPRSKTVNTVSRQYEAALAENDRAIATFKAVQAAYRSRQVGDDEYFAAKKKYDAAMAKFDADYQHEATRAGFDPISTQILRGGDEYLDLMRKRAQRPWRAKTVRDNTGMMDHERAAEAWGRELGADAARFPRPEAADVIAWWHRTVGGDNPTSAQYLVLIGAARRGWDQGVSDRGAAGKKMLEWEVGRSRGMNPGASAFTEIGYYDSEGYHVIERLPHGTSDSDAWLRAQRVSRELGHPVQLVGRGAPVTVSAGGVTVENPDSPDYTSMTDAQHARNFGRREAGASLNHDVARWKFAHDSYRKWLRLYVDKNLWPQLEDEWRAGYAEEMEERGHNPAGDPEDHKSAGYLGTIMASLASEGQFYDVMREHHGLSFFLKRHDDGDLTAKVRDMHQVQQGPEVVVPPDQIQDVYHYALHHGTMEGWEPGGVGRRDNPDEESVCIEDFCGSDEMGPTSFSADYFPHDGLTYFTGDWRSGVDIPPMPSPMQPTLRKVYEWAYQHGSDMKPWEGMENPRHMPPFRPGIDRVGSFHPRFVQESQMAELANLWHTSSTLYPGRYERMQWTSKWFAKEHPELTSTAVYKDLDAWLKFNRMENPQRAPVEIPRLITHANMEPLLDALLLEPEFQMGPTTHRYDAGDWYRQNVYLEFPTGEMAEGGMKTMALVGRHVPQHLPITASDRFNAQGLEGKVRVEKDLFGALMNLRDLLPPYRGQIVVPGRRGNPAASPEQYRLAQAVLSGTARSHMPESVAREIVERTPAGLRSEYSRYNPEPVTSSGKTIPLLKSGTYQDRQRWPKYATAISPSHPVASGSAAGKMLADRLPDWSKADHLDAARYYTEMAKEWGKEWGEAQREAHLETFGKEPGFADYKISGIGRDEYSESAKDRLRTLARDKGEAGTIAAAHRAAATVAARRHINPGGNPDWMSHRAVTGEDPTDVAFEAGKQWGETGAAESGVSNARVRHYGFMEWYNHQAPGHLYREGPPRRKLKRSQLEKAFNEGYKIGKERFNATYGGGRKRNPADSAAAADEMYRTFHGTEPTETVVVQEEIVHHGDIAALGDLEELVIVTPRGHKVVLDFTADPPLLCSSADGRQLLLRGGDMSIDLAAIKMNGDEWVKDVMVLGDVLSVTYRTAKTADSGKVLSYEHKFTDPEGMKGGDRAYPVLTYDTLNNRLEFAGGTSVNLEAGIVG